MYRRAGIRGLEIGGADECQLVVGVVNSHDKALEHLIADQAVELSAFDVAESRSGITPKR
jgi:hypothetical protein